MSSVRLNARHPEQVKRDADFYHLVTSTKYDDPGFRHIKDIQDRFGEPFREYEARLSRFERFTLRHGHTVERVMLVLFAVLLTALVVLVTT